MGIPQLFLQNPKHFEIAIKTIKTFKMKCRSCVVCDIKPTCDDKHYLHSVPVGNLVMRKLWIDFIECCATKRDVNFDRKSRFYVCSQHFLDNDYGIGSTGKRYLRKDAVPSIICSTIETTNRDAEYIKEDIKNAEENATNIQSGEQTAILEHKVVEQRNDIKPDEPDVKRTSRYQMNSIVEKLRKEFLLERDSLREETLECYTHEGFVFIQASGKRRNREGKLIKYLRCRRYRAPWYCIGTAVVHLKSGEIIVTAPKHNHGPEDDYQEDREFRLFLKYIALRNTSTTGQLYKCASKYYPNAARRISLKRIRGSMTAWRRDTKDQKITKEVDVVSPKIQISEREIPDIPPLLYFRVEEADLEDNVTIHVARNVERVETDDHDYVAKVPQNVTTLPGWLPDTPDEDADEDMVISLQCRICLERKFNHSFSCGHMTCGTCAARIYNMRQDCPICSLAFTGEPHVLHFH